MPSRKSDFNGVEPVEAKTIAATHAELTLYCERFGSRIDEDLSLLCDNEIKTAIVIFIDREVLRSTRLRDAMAVVLMYSK